MILVIAKFLSLSLSLSRRFSFTQTIACWQTTTTGRAHCKSPMSPNERANARRANRTPNKDGLAGRALGANRAASLITVGARKPAQQVPAAGA